VATGYPRNPRRDFFFSGDCDLILNLDITAS
jgi:hypothetical protein